MKKLSLKKDLYATDGRLLVRSGVKIDRKMIRAIRSMSEARNWKLSKIKETFLFNDLDSAMRDRRYKIIFAGPVTRQDILTVVKNVKIEEGILLELEEQKRRDPYTYRHTLIVAALTVKLTLTIKDVKYNKSVSLHTAFTHDLGKSRIPKKILGKTTPLTKDEYETIKAHPLIGYVLLNYYCRKDRALYSLISLQHHEKASGSGYPRGITKINKYTKLIQALDILDALMTSRPYRKTPYNIRQGLDFLINEVNHKRLSRKVVLTLVSFARKTKPSIRGMKIARLWREKPPTDKIYGKVI